MTLNYIGSKKKLLPFLEQCFRAQLGEIQEYKFGDGFCGTGIVGVHLNSKFNCYIHAVDLERYSWLITHTQLNIPFSDTIQSMIDTLNDAKPIDDIVFGSSPKEYRGLIYSHYSEKAGRLFFTDTNALKIDHLRSLIEEMRSSISIEEYYFLLASLVCSIDKVANVSCVYGAFLKQFKPSALKPFRLEPIHRRTVIRPLSFVQQVNITTVDWSDVDVVYFDPPYNARQYGANYFLLNDIIRMTPRTQEMRTITGLTDYNRSEFCQKTNVLKAFDNLLSSRLPRHVFISYNNEGLVSQDDFKKLLCKYGKITLYMTEYKKFKAQKNVEENTVMEYLWYIDTRTPSQVVRTVRI